MAGKWWDKSWNPVTGCTPVSAGCQHCYAERMHRRFSDRPFSEVTLHPERLEIPLRWRKPRRVFTCSMGDLFHEAVPFGFVMRCLNVMVQNPMHTYQILTKRPKRMHDFFTRWADLSGEDFEPKLVRGPKATRESHPSGRGKLFADMLESMGEPPEGCAYPTFDWLEGMIRWPRTFWNIWLGTSVSLPSDLDNISWLLKTPAAVRIVSFEPLLAALDLVGLIQTRCVAPIHPFPFLCNRSDHTRVGINWAILGGETGPGARPMDPNWARSVRDQCRAAGVPFFMKQMSGRQPIPEDLMIRQFPGDRL